MLSCHSALPYGDRKPEPQRKPRKPKPIGREPAALAEERRQAWRWTMRTLARLKKGAKQRNRVDECGSAAVMGRRGTLQDRQSSTIFRVTTGGDFTRAVATKLSAPRPCDAAQRLAESEAIMAHDTMYAE